MSRETLTPAQGSPFSARASLEASSPVVLNVSSRNTSPRVATEKF